MKLNFWKKQKKQNIRRSYSGSQLNRLTNDWGVGTTTADSEIRNSLPALRARSRQLGRDNDYAKAAFRELQVNIVGQGVRLQPRFQKQRGGVLDENLNSTTESVWCRWQRKQFCHVAGILSFQDMERLAIRAVAESGEIFFRKITQPFGGSKIPLALEVIESDMVDDSFSGIAPKTGNAVRMGVEIDQWKRPVAYWLHRKHPGDWAFGAEPKDRSNERIRIPASEIIHIFICDRPGQTRGVPWFHAALTRLRHMSGYEEAEIVGARAAASLMGFIQTPEGQLFGDDTNSSTNQQVTEFEPGVIKQLNPGEEIQVPNISRPGTQFDPFMRMMLRGVASSIGTTYEALSADFSQTNYSSARQALVSVRDFYKVIQDWLIESFHQNVFETWLDMATLSGALALPKFDVASEDYYESIKWQARGWQWIDPENEVAANERAVQAGFKTQGDVIAELGGDYEDVMAQREKEIQKAKKAGLVLSIDTPPKAVPKPPDPPTEGPKPKKP